MGLGETLVAGVAGYLRRGRAPHLAAADAAARFVFVLRGAPGSAVKPARIAPGGRGVAASVDQSPLGSRPRDQIRLKVSPPSSSKRLA